MIVRAFLATLATIAVPIAVGAAAEPAGTQPGYATKKICEVTSTIGTRLGNVRRCRTKAEWEEYRREMRDAVNRTQALKATVCNGGMVGTASRGTAPGSPFGLAC